MQHVSSGAWTADATEAIQVTQALGGTTPALPGMTVYLANIEIHDEGVPAFVSRIGIYTSRDAAKTAIRNWVVNEWVYDNNSIGEHPVPWPRLDLEDECDEPDTVYLTAMDAYLDTATDDAVLNFYFTRSDNDWSIDQEIVEPDPTPVA